MDWAFIASIFGIIGGIISIITLYIHFRDKKPKLKLSLNTKMKLSDLGNEVVITLEIINVGHRTVFIDYAGIEFPNNSAYREVNHIKFFPVELPPEQSQSFDFKAMSLIKKLESGGFPSEKGIKAVVFDKLGRKYKSEEILIIFNEIRTLQKVLDERDY